MKKNIIILILILISLLLLPEIHRIIFGCKKTYKVAHIASYSADFIWVKDIEKGIKESFKDHNCKIEYSAYYMDTKRKSTQEEIQVKATEARNFIKKEDPDIIITSDENALLYVAKPLQNSKYNFVSCGINGYPEKYGLNRNNIAIVLERLHYIEAVKVMQILYPKTKKIIILNEKTPTAKIVMQEFKEITEQIPVEIIGIYETNSFEQWKQIIKQYEGQVDAIFFLLYFALKDKNNKPVEANDVIKWITQNTTTPDFSVIPAYAVEGGLLTVSVNGFSQGYASANLALNILKGKKPSNIKDIKTKDGIIQINAIRAKQLKCRIPFKLYESSLIHW